MAHLQTIWKNKHYNILTSTLTSRNRFVPVFIIITADWLEGEEELVVIRIKSGYPSRSKSPIKRGKYQRKKKQKNHKW